jgi:hypothetical protein
MEALLAQHEDPMHQLMREAPEGRIPGDAHP